MLDEEIRYNWKTDIIGYAQIIPSLDGSEFPAWTIKTIDCFGVAIPYEGIDEINEKFASAKIYSSNIRFVNQSTKKAIILSTSAQNVDSTFSVLCAELVSPGFQGDHRKQITSSPVSWWKEWKEMLGNKNIDARIYDTLGELCVFLRLIRIGKNANWNGPDGASYDIESDDRFVEVKSTISRDKSEVTISNHFQLDPPGKPLDLVFCRFEPSVNSGFSIDSVVSELVRIGYNAKSLNDRLSKLGFEEGMSSRKSTFVLHEMLRYSIDSAFPRITPASFIGGVIPAGIVKITYTVDLSGMTPESIMQGVCYDLQNN